jgi:hypothetical protein
MSVVREAPGYIGQLKNVPLYRRSDNDRAAAWSSGMFAKLSFLDYAAGSQRQALEGALRAVKGWTTYDSSYIGLE